MNTFKKVKAILLPTDKESNIQKNKFNKLFYSELPIKYSDCDNLELVIVSDEEIKETCNWYIDDTGRVRHNVVQIKEYWDKRKDYKEIISSTDKSLNLPIPTDDFIKQWIEAGCTEDIEAEYETMLTGQCNCDCHNPNSSSVTLHFMPCCYPKTIESIAVINNTINCRLIQDDWDSVFNQYWSQCASGNRLEQWLKENYQAPIKK